MLFKEHLSILYSRFSSYKAADDPAELDGTSGHPYNAGDELNSSSTVGSSSATDYGYDQSGDMTSVTQVASANNPAISDSYTYDGNGLRQSETTGGASGTTTQLTWDTSGSLPVLLADGSTSLIYGPDGLPVEQIDGSGNVLYYHHDQQGSTRALTNQTGTVVASFTYDATGNLTNSTGSTKPILGYDGQLTDWDTGLIYLQARVYDPSTDQFLSRDPLDALTQQAYAYGDDNPLNMGDPSGLLFGSIFHAIGNVAHAAGSTIASGATWAYHHPMEIVTDAANACAITMFWNPVGDICGATSLVLGGAQTISATMDFLQGHGSLGQVALDAGGELLGYGGLRLMDNGGELADAGAKLYAQPGIANAIGGAAKVGGGTIELGSGEIVTWVATGAMYMPASADAATGSNTANGGC